MRMLLVSRQNVKACGVLAGIDISPPYDDILENLKVRYDHLQVLHHRRSECGAARSCRISGSEIGGPLQIVDASGKTIRANIIVQHSYTPRAALTQSTLLNGR